MTPYQRSEVKRIMTEKYKPGQHHSIPEALFRLCELHGLSLNKAKDIFLEVAEEREWSFAGSAVGAITFGNVEGKRGDRRILKWYIKQGGVWQTHFLVLKQELPK